MPIDADEDPLVIEARRQIIEHCLYGVDINPMAVEMAKLSLWLVSMDPQRPFTFLDDRLVAGDSLLGITSLDQLEYMHLDPAAGRKLHEDLFNWTAGVRSLVAKAATERRKLTEIDTTGSDPLAALSTKRAILKDIRNRTNQLHLFADLLVGASLANAKRGTAGFDTASVASAELAAKIASGAADEVDADDQRRQWLATDQAADGFDRFSLHWPLEFPEVFEKGGFDAIIGNPPFVHGSRITGYLGQSYREYLVSSVAKNIRGNADLVAYFSLRAHQIINELAQVGLIATNTLWQGDTRDVGLDQLTANGVTIRRAVKSEPWPSKSAVLEFCVVWTTSAAIEPATPRILDGVQVAEISSSLDAVGRTKGNPNRLRANHAVSFHGSKVDGMGFTLEPIAAAKIIEASDQYRDVLFPYINGKDLNSRPDASPSRWVVDFRDWTLERARGYPICFEKVLREVKPERDLNNRKVRRERWWQYAERAPGLYSAIAALNRVIVLTRHSKAVMPMMLPTKQVYSDATIVFASDDAAMLALLSSSPHFWWAATRASSMKIDVRYTPSDVFETFSSPELTDTMRRLGDELDTYRRGVMFGRELGLTKLYNLVFDESMRDPEIEELRRIHREIDVATVRAYGWDDLLEQGLDHGFHQAGAYARYTIGPAVRQEILDRLLELNHERYAEEVAAGLHDKKKPKKARAAKPAVDSQQDGLFDLSARDVPGSATEDGGRR